MTKVYDPTKVFFVLPRPFYPREPLLTWESVILKSGLIVKRLNPSMQSPIKLTREIISRQHRLTSRPSIFLVICSSRNHFSLLIPSRQTAWKVSIKWSTYFLCLFNHNEFISYFASSLYWRKKRFISPALLRTASNKAAVPGRENLASKGFELKYSRQAPVGNNMDENE